MNIVIGNAISLIAGIFIILSMWVNDEKKAYKYQFLNAFILIISSVFFLSWTGVVTMAIAAGRFCSFGPCSKYDGTCRNPADYCNNPAFSVQLLSKNNKANQNKLHCQQRNLYNLFPCNLGHLISSH